MDAVVDLSNARCHARLNAGRTYGGRVDPLRGLRRSEPVGRFEQLDQLVFLGSDQRQLSPRSPHSTKGRPMAIEFTDPGAIHDITTASPYSETPTS
jgi:hypothetical protein